MISVVNSDIINYIKNPKKLRLTMFTDRKAIENNKNHIELFFDSLSSNTTIEELHLSPPSINEYSSQSDYFSSIYDYVKFPQNLKKLVLPLSYGHRLINNIPHIIDIEPYRLPHSLEEIVLPDIDCLFNTNICDTNIKRIILYNSGQPHIEQKSYHIQHLHGICDRYKNYFNIPTLESITFYSCQNTEILDTIMKHVNLPYGCTYSFNTDKYSDATIVDTATITPKLEETTKKLKLNSHKNI